MKTRLYVALGASALILAGALVAFTGGASSANQTNVISLHNNTAGAGTDCPKDGAAYWHFVLAPNNGKSAFVSITLNLKKGDTTEAVTFTGFPPIIKNGSQTDNVFVAVPAGHTLTDLLTTGSYAVYSGDRPHKFNLSHVCQGTVPSTTTTTSTPVTYTIPETSSTTVPESTTTTDPGSTTTTTVKPTTTTVPAAEAAPAAAVQTNPAVTG